MKYHYECNACLMKFEPGETVEAWEHSQYDHLSPSDIYMVTVNFTLVQLDPYTE